MSKLSVNCFSISLDGYGAGPRQNMENPLGVGGPKVHAWMRKTQAFRARHGNTGGSTGIDDDFVARGFRTVGAWIMGRNMFGPIRGRWPDNNWKGWWGVNPPFHAPVFVLTHYARSPIAMEGGTTFHFVTGSIEDALMRAKVAAGGKDVRLGGGISTLRQYLAAGLVDDMHIAMAHVLLGEGESLFAGLDLANLGYQVIETAASDAVTHVVIARA